MPAETIGGAPQRAERPAPSAPQPAERAASDYLQRAAHERAMYEQRILHLEWLVHEMAAVACSSQGHESRADAVLRIAPWLVQSLSY